MSASFINLSPQGSFSRCWNQCIDKNTPYFIRLRKSIVVFFEALFRGRTVSEAEAEVDTVLQKGEHENSIFFKECTRKFKALNIEIVKAPSNEEQKNHD